MNFAQCPNQSRALAREERKSRARDLGAGREVENAESRPELPMGTGLEIEARRVTPRPQHAIGRRVAVRNVRSRKIRDAKRLGLECRFDLSQAGVQPLHLFARGLETGHQLVGRLLGALAPGHLLRRRVPLGLDRLGLHQKLAALAVEIEHGVDHGEE